MKAQTKARRPRYRIVKKERNRVTRTIVEVIDNRDGKFAQDGLDWATLCEDHGKQAGHDTRALAIDASRDPSGWCAPCRKAAR